MEGEELKQRRKRMRAGEREEQRNQMERRKGKVVGEVKPVQCQGTEWKRGKQEPQRQKCGTEEGRLQGRQ